MQTQNPPDKVQLSEWLGLVPERESVDDALMIVESYGPWGADLNDAHRRQIVLADEVHRLRHLYEMAVRGRAEMRTALRQDDGQTLWNACARAGEVERNKLRARLMDMHERDKDRHNYWQCAVVELFGA